MKNLFLLLLVFSITRAYAQNNGTTALYKNRQSSVQESCISKVWVSDNGDGTYKNPILHADYSDPDAIRVGDDFYMVSSSFEDLPGLPILHSKDLVNWTILAHALNRLPPIEHFSKTQHGNGVWAPSIRYHKGEFYIYYPDPDFGIYLIKAKNAAGPWSTPILVEAGKGLIDPCPLWDDKNKNYLVHAYAGSRAGIKSVIVVKRLNADGTKTTDEGKLVYDGHETDPTIEGPKFYKRNGWYYIFCPAGGVSTGWQLVLRSKKIYGPYERKVVMDEGGSKINGPHQGAWVTTQSGEDWFIHFQDKAAYGRVVHLNPVKWINDWPVIGVDRDGDGKGEPVINFKKPIAGKAYPIQTPIEDDEFNGTEPGLQWQWMGNPKATWLFNSPSNGVLRLYSQRIDSVPNLWFAPNVLLQKFAAEKFIVTTKLTFKPNTKLEDEKSGLTIMGMSYANIALKNKRDGIYLVTTVCNDAENANSEKETLISKAVNSTVYFQVRVSDGGICQFSYSFDGDVFTVAGNPFTAVAGKWIGAKFGIFCTRLSQVNDAGFADFDWVRIDPFK